MKLSPEDEAKRFDRLPVWAQNRIRRLENDVVSMSNKIEELSTTHPDTNVVINGFVRDPDYELPKDSQIDFVMEKPTPNSWRNRISVGHERRNGGRDALRIQGDMPLILKMNATNSMLVMLDEDR
jgi:hypothetical protein